jgi:hypothetical protein
MAILGHSQISLTMNTYSHFIPEMGEEVASHMHDILSKQDGKAIHDPSEEPVATSMATQTSSGVVQ